MLLQQSGTGFFQALLWLTALIGAVFVGGVVLVLLRRRVFGSDGPAPGDALDLHTLRQMRADGRISEEEYEAARRALIGELGGASARSEQGVRRPEAGEIGPPDGGPPHASDPP